MDSAIWIPLAILFGTALITALVRRHSKDPCLKPLNGSFVFVRLKEGKWIWGELVVYSNALELIYPYGKVFNDYCKKSYLFYEHNLDAIDKVVRPSPAEDTREHELWLAEVRALQAPSPARRLKRRIRNTFNMLRDAFTQAFMMIFGAVKKHGALSKMNIGDDKVSEVTRSLLGVIPNAYEPALEEYLGKRVVVETILPDKTLEQTGVLQEYSSKYVLVRDVEYLAEPPPKTDAMPQQVRTFDVAFVRPLSNVRHLAVRSEGMGVQG
jgi:hypothetical protein